MKRTLVALSATAIVGLTSVFFSTPVKAEMTPNEINDERSEIKQNLSNTEGKIADVVIELNELNKEIKRVEESLEQNQKMLSETDEEISKTEDEINKLETEITELENSIKKRYGILKDRAVSLQQTGGSISYLEVIFGSESFGDFISRVSTVNKISESDKNLIEQQEADKKLVEEKQNEMLDKLDKSKQLKAELEEMEKLIEDQKLQNEKRKKELKSKEQELKVKKEELQMRDSELAALEQKIKNSTSQLTTLSATSDSNNSDSSPKTVAGSGKLAWPTSGGYVSSGKGPRWNRQHKGMDIARTDRSTVPPIYAAEDGVVESARSNSGGYGNRIVIRHSNGLKTTYSHLSSISVSAGQSVSRGSKIGVMGTTGNSTGIHLHFEVYKNGSLQNPADYL